MARQPSIYLPHGGGPWPWMGDEAFRGLGSMAGLRGFLAALPSLLPARPRAILVATAHWEAPIATFGVGESPPMLYDYAGFPDHTYQIRWPAPGEPGVARRARALLDAAGLPSAEDPIRGFDHGTFVPLAVAWPDADVPVVQLSLVRGLDPALHLDIGRALAPLRDEGVLIVGSGMSYHDLRGYGTARGAEHAERFDAWLREAITAAPDVRDRALVAWAAAPSARAAHPREEHLIPLHVAAGAAAGDAGAVPFSEPVLGTRVSAAWFGAAPAQPG
jgi:aromatic ring-opening dioxygenase catalytic subunit (LigB family)